LSRKVKCPGCNEWFIREETEYIFDEKKKRYFHKECYESVSNISSDRESLYTYMCKLFGYEYVMPYIKKQINEMIEEYNFTFKGIELTLDYMYRIEKMNKEKANGGVALVPRFYNKAKDLYIRKMEIQESKSLNYETVELTVIIGKERKRTKGKLINIGEL